MDLIVRILGVAIILLGAALFFNPKLIKAVISYFKQGKRVFLVAVIRLVLGAILLLAAAQCVNSMVVSAIGALFVISGIIVFALGADRSKAILGKMGEKPPALLRLMALIPILIGSLLVWAA